MSDEVKKEEKKKQSITLYPDKVSVKVGSTIVKPSEDKKNNKEK